MSGKSGAELAREMADALMNVFGAAKPTDDEREELADHLVKVGLRWVNDRYKCGVR